MRILGQTTLVALAVGALPWIVDSAIKAFCLLAVAGLIVFVLRRASAATRHCVWMAVFVGLLALPVVSATCPRLRVLPRWLDASVAIGAWDDEGRNHADRRTLPKEARVPTVTSRPGDESQPPFGNETLREPWNQNADALMEPVTEYVEAPATLSGDESRGERYVADASRDSRAPATVSTVAFNDNDHARVAALIVTAWMIGVVVCFGRILLSGASLALLAFTSEPVRDERAIRLFEQLCQQLKIRRRVRLLSSSRRDMPIVWGILWPRVLVPSDWTSWDDNRLRAVLLHELAHVQRRDTLAQLLVQVACAVYWFHPLVWIAAWRVRVERERACDDAVLAGGVKASEYAEHLLAIATRYAANRLSGVAAVGMARSCRLESRIATILKARVDRSGLAWRVALLSLLGVAAVALPLALLDAADPPTLPAVTAQNPFASNQPGYPIWSPFTGVKWEKNRPIVQVNERWYELVSIHGVTTDAILKKCEKEGWDTRKRVAEDLVQILRLMDHKVEKTTDLVLRDKEGKTITMKNVAMTKDKRRRVMRGSRANGRSSRPANDDPQVWIDPATGKRWARMIYGRAFVGDDKTLLKSGQLKLRIKRGTSGTYYSTEETDDDGAFAFVLRDPIPSDSRMMIAYEGHVEFTADCGEEPDRLRRDIVFKPFSGRNTGHVTTTGGIPLAGEVIFDRNTAHERTRRIDERGVFHLDGINAGEHEVTVRYFDYRRASERRTRTINVGTDANPTKPAIELDAGRTITVEFDLPDGQQLTYANLFWSLRAEDETPQKWGDISTQTDGHNGRIFLAGLPESGALELIAHALAHDGKTQQRYYGRRRVELKPDAMSPRTPVKMAALEPVRIRIVDADGKPVANAVATTKPNLAAYMLGPELNRPQAFSGPPFSRSHQILAGVLDRIFMQEDREADAVGSYVLNRVPDSRESVFVLSNRGGAALTADEIAKLRDGATLRIGSTSFLAGRATYVVPRGEKGDIDQLAPFFYVLTFDRGAAIKQLTDRRGNFCIFLGDRTPTRLELTSTRERSKSKTVEQPQRGRLLELRFRGSGGANEEVQE